MRLDADDDTATLVGEEAGRPSDVDSKAPTAVGEEGAGNEHGEAAVGVRVAAEDED